LPNSVPAGIEALSELLFFQAWYQRFNSKAKLGHSNVASLLTVLEKIRPNRARKGGFIQEGLE
jgi:hypothetical protein